VSRALIVTQQGRTTALDLDGKTTIVIGRSSSCDVFLDEDSVSRRHALLHVHPDRIEIEDLGSQNGTRLLGVIRNGDSVETARGDETQLAANALVPLGEDKMVLIGTAQLMLRASAVADEVPEELRARAEDAERRRVLDALRECAGNQTRAARRLGITRRALVRRLEKFKLPRPRRDR
jgi:pSer/pThr/pTyr-binding forkhead associated (FHA) protein